MKTILINDNIIVYLMKYIIIHQENKYKLSDAINIYISLEVITFIIIEVVKYVFLDKLFIRLQKDH